jgi:hypothetical protein
VSNHGEAAACAEIFLASEFVGQDSDFSEQHRKAFLVLPARVAANPDIVPLPFA